MGKGMQSIFPIRSFCQVTLRYFLLLINRYTPLTQLNIQSIKSITSLHKYSTNFHLSLDEI